MHYHVSLEAVSLLHLFFVAASIDAPTVNLQVLYINPTGANPTGTLLSVERRKEIYQLCCDYNLLLLEDDPYYYLQFGDKDTRPPSFLSLDTQGRVLRSPLFIF